MSRLDTLSADAVASMFSPESRDGLAMLLKLYGGGIDDPLYISSVGEERLSETSENVTYGLTSNGIPHLFLPMDVKLPTDEDEAPPTAQIVVHDITRQVKALLRGASSRISVDMSLVLIDTPDVIEVEYLGLEFSDFSYEGDRITCTLGYPSDITEPIPCDTLTPANFPGAF